MKMENQPFPPEVNHPRNKRMITALMFVAISGISLSLGIFLGRNYPVSRTTPSMTPSFSVASSPLNQATISAMAQSSWLEYVFLARPTYRGNEKDGIVAGRNLHDLAFCYEDINHPLNAHISFSGNSFTREEIEGRLLDRSLLQEIDQILSTFRYLD